MPGLSFAILILADSTGDSKLVSGKLIDLPEASKTEIRVILSSSNFDWMVNSFTAGFGNTLNKSGN